MLTAHPVTPANNSYGEGKRCRTVPTSSTVLPTKESTIMIQYGRGKDIRVTAGIKPTPQRSMELSRVADETPVAGQKLLECSMQGV